jgi:5,10-methylene-tetrahydrofolate dehydrogenase/methenyl tetrahydrofolate cyclohydrolase
MFDREIIGGTCRQTPPTLAISEFAPAVPSGVGLVIVTMLIHNIVQSAEQRSEKDAA